LFWRCLLNLSGLGGGFAPRHLKRWVLSCKIGGCMQKIAFLIFLILFCAFNLSAQTKLTQEEYAVYASVLKVIYKENRETYSNKSEFVIVNETKIDPELELPSDRRYRTLAKDFKRKNSTSGIVEKRFPRGAYSETYYLVAQTEIDDINEIARIEYEKRYAVEKLNPSIANPGGSSWTTFYQKYPEASGYYNLSRVGFSGQLAMVQVKGDLGWNGFSRTYILRRVKSKWRIITFSGSEWIS
jgi:hypothetical protein